MAGHKNIDKVRMSFCNKDRDIIARLLAKQEPMMIFLSASSRGCTTCGGRSINQEKNGSYR